MLSMISIWSKWCEKYAIVYRLQKEKTLMYSGFTVDCWKNQEAAPRALLLPMEPHQKIWTLLEAIEIVKQWQNLLLALTWNKESFEICQKCYIIKLSFWNIGKDLNCISENVTFFPNRYAQKQNVVYSMKYNLFWKSCQLISSGTASGLVCINFKRHKLPNLPQSRVLSLMVSTTLNPVIRLWSSWLPCGFEKL